MLGHRKLTPVAFVACFAAFLLLLHIARGRSTWRQLPQVVGLGELDSQDTDVSEPTATSFEVSRATSTRKPGQLGARPTFSPGTPKPLGSEYSRILVIAKVKEENTGWIDEELPGVEKAIYVADDPSAAFHPPKNKGHEVMVYLTYLIDHYEEVPDVMIFMHAHRWTWHNNDLMNHDAVEMVRRLSSERVMREGYMNMRCQWQPGCPNWIHPGKIDQDVNKQEEILVAESWSELFPREPIPQVLAAPCCGQFSLSRERVHSIPKTTFIFYREWLLKTDISDYLSGRVFEYIWQYIFTGKNSWCPVQHVCYCDAYGICFGGEDKFEQWFKMRKEKDDLEEELQEWKEKARKIENSKSDGRVDEGADLEVPELGKDVFMERVIQELDQKMDLAVKEAIDRGNDPRNRAAEAGREWKDGDGF